MANLETNETVGKKQYIVVKLGSEQYGIDIGYVDNIVRMQKITRVPKSHHYFDGIINLRGEIVPVMSIRRKMGFEDDVFTKDSRIIILKIDDLGLLGVIVDEVKEVVNLGADEIELPGQNGKANDDTFISGIGKHSNELISIFDITSIYDED
ncbi:MAG: chemotaxis protein CheW [Lachnospiraceae bacterium]|nr:chemotaxis protein CheW [Lachnospiraceae bacterium]